MDTTLGGRENYEVKTGVGHPSMDKWGSTIQVRSCSISMAMRLPGWRQLNTVIDTKEGENTQR